MKTLLIASLVAATATAAHADPLSVSKTATDASAPSTYVQGGAMIGGNDGYVTVGGSAELGARVTPFLWLHGSVTGGLADAGLFTVGSGSMLQVRAGADVMSCGHSGVVCAYVGADAGFQHTQFSGYQTSLWSGDTSSGNMSIDDSTSRMIGVARVGLDIGGTHLRWRPGLEVAVAGDGVNGANITQSIAYRF